ncbi:MAG TPA: ANTAR domain-containing protein [Gemmatimonadaceae bacterium]|nr:ANTAR domain-containing protein [Gemmatimonadaceae bacterium]
MAPTPRLRVLLAEDDEDARATLAELLAALGHSVVATVATGNEAASLVAGLAPDVVLLDVHMPDGTGTEAAAAITAARPGTAVVLFTGDATLELTSDEVEKSGAHAVLPKPAPPPLIDSTLRLAVSRARESETARKEAEKAQRLLEERKIIERAKGILMRRTGCSEQEAWRILQRSSQDRSVPMVDIARAVLESERPPS